MKQARYEVVPGLRVASFDGESVVFNPSSWETHVLNVAASLLLEAVASAPCSEADLVEVLTEALDDEDRLQAAEHVRQVVADFGRLRLVRAQPTAADAGK